MRVFLTGGTGYVGTVVVRRLLEAGHEVRALAREGGRPLEAGAIRVKGDLSSMKALEEGMDGAEAIVHLVGIIRERPGASFHQIHVESTRTLLSLASHRGVGTFLHMSALGADARATTAYFRTKGEAELLVRKSPLAWTIFRPSLVFGPGGPGPNFLSDLRTKLLSLPRHPLFGRGDQKLQPISIDTVATAFARALSVPETRGKIYSLAGPDVLPFREILERLAAADGRALRPVSLPVGLMRMLLPALEHLPSFPLTSDQFAMLMKGSWDPDWRVAHEELGLPPVPFTVS